MKSVLVVFNGIKFPFHLMKYSIDEAKAHDASLHALFLKGKEDDAEGYGFPNDMAQVETLTNSEDARRDDEKIIRHHMKLAEDMATTEGISFSRELLTDSSLSEITTIIQPFDLVCLDAAYDDYTPSMLTNDRFTSKDLIKHAPDTVRLISEDKEI